MCRYLSQIKSRPRLQKKVTASLFLYLSCALASCWHINIQDTALWLLLSETLGHTSMYMFGAMLFSLWCNGQHQHTCYTELRADGLPHQVCTLALVLSIRETWTWCKTRTCRQVSTCTILQPSLLYWPRRCHGGHTTCEKQTKIRNVTFSRLLAAWIQMPVSSTARCHLLEQETTHLQVIYYLLRPSSFLRHLLLFLPVTFLQHMQDHSSSSRRL